VQSAIATRATALTMMLCLLAATGVAQTPQAKIERTIDSLFAEYTNTPGVAIAVVRNGEISFLKGYGVANLEYQTPITPRTVFNIASVSKQFTAFAIYLLERQGRLSLEDDIRKYVPEVPDHGAPIRIRHLLAHTSGLRDQAALMALAGWQPGDVATTEQIVRLVSRQNALNFRTGTAFGYSNTGYTLLAEAVARITGMSFSEYTRVNIFEPLGMRSTVFYDDFHRVLDRNRAYSYARVNGEFVKRELNYSNPGSSDLMTTAEDLVRWVRNFDHPVVGDARLISDFNRISVLDNGGPVIWSASPGDTTYHAKGQLHYRYNGLGVISHGGHTGGFRATLTRFPDDDLAIITLSNNEHYTMMAKVFPIVDMYLSSRFTASAPAGNAPAPRNTPSVPARVDSRLSDFVGDYGSEELATRYQVQVRHGKLLLTHPRLRDVELTPSVEADKFTGTSTFPFELKFLRRGPAVTGFEITNFGARDVRFERRE
jgi:CubicO group peptidase (beta-lactamase class C family)